MVVESEVLKAQTCALSKLSLPLHSNVVVMHHWLFQLLYWQKVVKSVRYKYWLPFDRSSLPTRAISNGDIYIVGHTF